jgi:hypothetical protein
MSQQSCQSCIIIIDSALYKGRFTDRNRRTIFPNYIFHRYVRTGLARKVQENQRNLEGFNGESYQLGDNKEVYDAELFGIAVAIRHAAQRFGTDTQRITVFTDSQATLHCIKKSQRGSRTSLYENGL